MTKRALLLLLLLIQPSGQAEADSLGKLPTYYGVFMLDDGQLVELQRHPQSRVGQVARQMDLDMTISSVSNTVLSSNNVTFIVFAPNAKSLATQGIWVHLVTPIVAESEHGGRLKKLRENSWLVNIKKGWKLRISPVSGQNEMIIATFSDIPPGRKALNIGDDYYDFLVPGQPVPSENCLVKIVKQGFALKIGGNISYEPCPPQWVPMPQGQLIARKLYRSAEKKFQKGDFAKALSLLEEASRQPNAEEEMGEIFYLKAATEGTLGKVSDALFSITTAQQKKLSSSQKASAKVIEAGIYLTLEDFDAALSALDMAQKLSRRSAKQFIPSIYLMRYIGRLGRGDPDAQDQFCAEACKYKMRSLKAVATYILGNGRDWSGLSYDEKAFAAFHHCFRGERKLAREIFDSILSEGNRRYSYYDALQARQKIDTSSYCSVARTAAR